MLERAEEGKRCPCHPFPRSKELSMKRDDICLGRREGLNPGVRLDTYHHDFLNEAFQRPRMLMPSQWLPNKPPELCEVRWMTAFTIPLLTFKYSWKQAATHWVAGHQSMKLSVRPTAVRPSTREKTKTQYAGQGSETEDLDPCLALGRDLHACWSDLSLVCIISHPLVGLGCTFAH